MDDNNLTQSEADQARLLAQVADEATYLLKCRPENLLFCLEELRKRNEVLEKKLKELEMNPPAIQRKVQKVNETWVIMQRLDPVSANVFPRLASWYASPMSYKVLPGRGGDKARLKVSQGSQRTRRPKIHRWNARQIEEVEKKTAELCAYFLVPKSKES